MSITRAARLALTKIERENQFLKEEKITLVDTEGKIFFEKVGIADRCEFSFIEQMKQLTRALRGKRDNLTHNHPVYSPLSVTDIKTAVLLRLNEIRATTNHGLLHIMELPKNFSVRDAKKATIFLDNMFHIGTPRLRDFLMHRSRFKKDLQRYIAQQMRSPTRKQRKLIEREIGVRFRTLKIEGQEVVRPPANPFDLGETVKMIKQGKPIKMTWA